MKCLDFKFKILLLCILILIPTVTDSATTFNLSKAPNSLGLVGYWTFDGKDVTDKVYDRSGQNNHGYFIGGATSSAKTIGKIGQALNFDGGDDYVNNINIGAAGTSGWTESAWIKTRDTSAGMIVTNRLVADDRSMSLHLGFWAGTAQNDGKIYFSNDGPTCEWGAVSTTNIADGNWHHVVGTRPSSGVYHIYVDGLLSGNTNKTVGSGCQESSANASGKWLIGNGPAWSFSAFNGLIDDVRIYSRVLSASEVKQLYNLGH